MQDKSAMELSGAIKELAQEKGMDLKDLIGQAREICKKYEEPIKREIAVQNMVERVKA